MRKTVMLKSLVGLFQNIQMVNSSVEKDRVFGEVISWIGSVDHVRSTFFLSCEESTWGKGIGGGNLWNFNERDGELSKKKRHFRVEGCCCGWQWLWWRWLEKCLSWRKIFPG